MAGAPRTKVRFEKILSAAREVGPNASAIAKLAGCDRATAKRLLDVGWPELPWARPIRDLLREEGDEARTRAAARAKAGVEAVTQDAARKREASVELLAAERALISAGRQAVVQLARSAFEHRDLIGTLLDRVQAEAGTMRVRDLAPLLRELRQLLGAIPDLAVKLAQEGREHREEQGTPGGVAPPGESVELAPEMLLEALEDAVHNLGQVSRRGADAFWPGASWTPKESLISSVRQLARGVGIELGPNEPHDLSPEDVGFQTNGREPPRRVDAEAVERAREDLPERLARSADHQAAVAFEREEGPAPAEEPAPARVLLLGDGRQIER